MLVAQSTQEVAHYHVDVLDCALSLQFKHYLTVKAYTYPVPDKPSICLSEQLVISGHAKCVIAVEHGEWK